MFRENAICLLQSYTHVCSFIKNVRAAQPHQPPKRKLKETPNYNFHYDETTLSMRHFKDVLRTLEPNYYTESFINEFLKVINTLWRVSYHCPKQC